MLGDIEGEMVSRKRSSKAKAQKTKKEHEDSQGMHDS